MAKYLHFEMEYYYIVDFYVNCQIIYSFYYPDTVEVNHLTLLDKAIASFKIANPTITCNDIRVNHVRRFYK